MSETKNQNPVQVTIVQVPVSEWDETKNLIAEIAQTLKDNADKTSEYVTPNEICEMLKIGRATFDRMKAKKIIPMYRIEGSKRLYGKRSEIMRLMHAGKLEV